MSPSVDEILTAAHQPSEWRSLMNILRRAPRQEKTRLMQCLADVDVSLAVLFARDVGVRRSEAVLLVRPVVCGLDASEMGKPIQILSSYLTQDNLDTELLGLRTTHPEAYRVARFWIGHGLLQRV